MKIKQLKNMNKAINIWEYPYGYSTKSKLENMNIDYDANYLDSNIRYSREITNDEFTDISRLADTFTYLHEIKRGYELETYEDIPYIIPYEVKGAKYGVIVLSGGGFGFKTIDGMRSGGVNIAEILNKRGISAYLLHYRSNPYRFPIPMLDLQRAIKYLRYNKKNFEFDELILMGFSAGGYTVASFIYQYMGKTIENNYLEDVIDSIDDYVNKIILIYPQLSFNHHKPMLNVVFDKEDIDTEEKREEIVNSLDIKKHIDNNEIIQFIAYGSADTTVSQQSVEEYIYVCKEKKINTSRIFLPGEGHGFRDELYVEELVKWINFY